MKRKINKIISLTLCCLVISTVVVSAQTKGSSSNNKSCCSNAFDPLPNESDPPK